MSLYHPKYRKEARQLKPEVAAFVVHAFLKRVQAYSEEEIEKRWKQLKKRRGRDFEDLQKISRWIQYHRFNEIALHEIEDGTLDNWFKKLLK